MFLLLLYLPVEVSFGLRRLQITNTIAKIRTPATPKITQRMKSVRGATAVGGVTVVDGAIVDKKYNNVHAK